MVHPNRNILMVCDVFPPQFAPRMGALAMNLKKMGYGVYVVCGKCTGNRADMDAFVGYADEVHVIDQIPHRFWNPLHLLTLFWPYDYLRNEYELRRIGIDLTKKHKFDLVLVSRSFGMFPCVTGLAIAKQADIPCVIDIRDVYAQGPNLPVWRLPIREMATRIMRMFSYNAQVRHYNCWRKASALVTVSPWNANYLRHYNPNTYCIYNGYDPDIFKPNPPEKNDVFTIVYTGTFGDRNLRDYSLLFEAMRRLADENLIKPENFQVEFYSGRGYDKEVNVWIDRLQLRDFVSFNDFVPTSTLPRIFQRTSVLLLLANRASKYGPWGIMTTKVYEYFASNRPVLLVRSDEDCLEAAINDANAGHAGRSVEDTYQFLKDKIAEWRVHGFTRGTTRQETIEKYSRKKQAEQFIEVFDKVLRNETC